MKFLAFILVADFFFNLELSVESTTTHFRRPRFSAKINGLLDSMAKDNAYSWTKKRNYHKCHIVPWNFMEQMISKFNTKNLSSTTGITFNVTLNFIEDLSKIHVDATFYKNLGITTSKKLRDTVKEKRLIALDLLDYFLLKRTTKETKERKYLLLQTLFNMPSNLFPGNAPSNMGIKDRFDPPRKDTKGSRSMDATKTAKDIFKKYENDGLVGFKDTSDPNKIKSSDVEGNGKQYEKQKDPKIYVNVS